MPIPFTQIADEPFFFTTDYLEQPLAATKYLDHGDTEARRKKSAEARVPSDSTVTFDRLSQILLSHASSPCLRVLRGRFFSVDHGRSRNFTEKLNK